VDEIRAAGLVVGILSDQTDWLDELDAKTYLYRHFDRVFNSYRTGKSKHDETVFSDVAGALGLEPREVLFVDDREGNISRAGSAGMEGILFGNVEGSVREIRSRLGLVRAAPKE
jgi:putative hydrolase of the HAD superfamily